VAYSTQFRGSTRFLFFHFQFLQKINVLAPGIFGRVKKLSKIVNFNWFLASWHNPRVIHPRVWFSWNWICV